MAKVSPSPLLCVCTLFLLLVQGSLAGSIPSPLDSGSVSQEETELIQRICSEKDETKLMKVFSCVNPTSAEYDKCTKETGFPVISALDLRINLCGSPSEYVRSDPSKVDKNIMDQMRECMIRSGVIQKQRQQFEEYKKMSQEQKDQKDLKLKQDVTQCVKQSLK